MTGVFHSKITKNLKTSMCPVTLKQIKRSPVSHLQDTEPAIPRSQSLLYYLAIQCFKVDSFQFQVVSSTGEKKNNSNLGNIIKKDIIKFKINMQKRSDSKKITHREKHDTI